MSIFSADQRAFIRADTGIDPLVIDRVVEAYDALIEHDDVEAYKRLIATAIVQCGYENLVIPQADKPSPVDIVKSLCTRRISDLRRWDYQRTCRYLAHALERSTR